MKRKTRMSDDNKWIIHTIYFETWEERQWKKLKGFFKSMIADLKAAIF